MRAPGRRAPTGKTMNLLPGGFAIIGTKRLRGRYGRLAIASVACALVGTACAPTGTEPHACGSVGPVEPPATEVAPPAGPLRADGSGRFVLTAEGKPFFWLGDTAWVMVNKASRADVDRYLLDRSAKMFNVVQILVGRDTGDVRYWSKVDHLVEGAAALGMYVAMVPCWHCLEDPAGCWECGKDPQGIDEAAIGAYGRFLGSRYGDDSVVWLLGGDGGQDGLSAAEHDRYTLLAESIASVAGGQEEVFIGFQPSGAMSSSAWFHTDAWLDFNTLQSSHTINMPNYDLIAEDYGKTPVKPTHEGESIYEGIAERFWESVDNARGSAWDARKGAYWGVFAGGFGHTYGAEGVWDWTLGREVGQPNCCSNQPHPWYAAIAFPGSSQMQYLRRLIESRPFLVRIPDQSVVTSGAGWGDTRVQATRGSDGSYALIYISDGHAITVAMTTIVCGNVHAWWFDPRTGVATSIGTFANTGTRTFTPPSSGPGTDWVLVLDDATRNFLAPGQGVGTVTPPSTPTADAALGAIDPRLG